MELNKNKPILFVCERSAGHIFPALALASQIRHRNSELPVVFFVTALSLRNVLEERGFRVFGKAFSKRIMVVEMIWRFFEAIYLLIRLKPSKVIGFGGRDSVFCVLFASLAGAETVIYDPNTHMGKANAFLSIFVKKILRGLPVAKQRKKQEVIGVPLRENIQYLDRKKAKEALGFDERPVLFCQGGSQGSSFLNDTFVELIQRLGNTVQFIHLTGPLEYEKVKRKYRYRKVDTPSYIKDFDYEIQNLYSAADLIISRSGASSLAEIAYFQIPSILIPHPQAGGHQKDNALYFKNHEAAEVMLQDDISIDNLEEMVRSILFNQERMEKMKKNLQSMSVGVDPAEFALRISWLYED